MTSSVKNLALVQQLARKHLGAGDMASSARSCLAESIALSEKPDVDGNQWGYAANRALRSIAYSVGIFHADYKRAWNAAGLTGEPRLVS